MSDQQYLEFPVDVKPVHSGVYQTVGPTEVWNDWYNYFDAVTGEWLQSTRYPEKASSKPVYITDRLPFQRWRGIKK